MYTINLSAVTTPSLRLQYTEDAAQCDDCPSSDIIIFQIAEDSDSQITRVLYVDLDRQTDGRPLICSVVIAISINEFSKQTRLFYYGSLYTGCVRTD